MLLACFKSPSQVSKFVKEQFEIEVERQAVEAYDPTKVAGKDLSEELKELFQETRAKYIESVGNVAVAHQRYRLDKIQEVIERAESGRLINDALLMQALELGAKERGGMFTNRREHTGAGGGPIQTVGLSLDEWKAQAKARREQAEAAMQPFEGE